MNIKIKIIKFDLIQNNFKSNLNTNEFDQIQFVCSYKRGHMGLITVDPEKEF
jgi:hypothetical protein